jgi:hypothetical protein
LGGRRWESSGKREYHSFPLPIEMERLLNFSEGVLGHLWNSQGKGLSLIFVSSLFYKLRRLHRTAFGMDVISPYRQLYFAAPYSYMSIKICELHHI